MIPPLLQIDDGVFIRPDHIVRAQILVELQETNFLGKKGVRNVCSLQIMLSTGEQHTVEDCWARELCAMLGIEDEWKETLSRSLLGFGHLAPGESLSPEELKYTEEMEASRRLLEGVDVAQLKAAPEARLEGEDDSNQGYDS